MPKPLSRPQPTSSVAGMLQQGIGAALISKPQHVPEAAAPVAAGIPRQFLLTRSADRALKQIQDAFSTSTGLELRQSELLRALLTAVEQIIPAVREQATKLGQLRRPKNGPGGEAAQALLERRLADVFLTAAQTAPKGGLTSELPRIL